MTNNCKGILGWIFGHKYQSMIVRTRPYGDLNLTGNYFSSTIEKVFEERQYRWYVVCCKRCGKVVEEVEDDNSLHKRTYKEYDSV